MLSEFCQNFVMLFVVAPAVGVYGQDSVSASTTIIHVSALAVVMLTHSFNTSGYIYSLKVLLQWLLYQLCTTATRRTPDPGHMHNPLHICEACERYRHLFSLVFSDKSI